MILIKNVFTELSADFTDAKRLLADSLKIKYSDIISAQLYRKSVDARHKGRIRFCCSFTATLVNENSYLKKNKNAEKYSEQPYEWKKAEAKTRPIVVGFGPAGMFAALSLARAGLNPIVIERGEAAPDREKSVKRFFEGGQLNTESNIQFGEGGAGTFSDGKLNSGIKDIRCRTVLGELVAFGAPQKILCEAKPHIGTDILINIVVAIRQEIERLGGEVRFSTRLEDISVCEGKIVSATLSSGDIIGCENIILAIGHSARDTFKMLHGRGVLLMPKPFSVGVRIEHRQKDINSAMYGDFANIEYLGAADYKMAVHLENGRGVYTFCMCPGGEVVNASSDVGGIAVNGMSSSYRAGGNANSALLVEVHPEDLSEEDIFSGVNFQRELEQKAYNAANTGVPYCYVGDLLGKEYNAEYIKPTVKPRAVKTDIAEVLPDFVTESLMQAIPLFGKKIKGFDNPSAVLSFPETRSTSPLRISRTDTFESVSVGGLYPAGEGAGYAGGIMSAAVDGLKCAEALIEALNNGK